MNKKDKQIVKKVGCTMENVYACYTRDIEEYTELIRADEREACAEHYLGIMRDAVTEARKDERAACAVIADRYDNGRADNAADLIANEIRERGEK